MVARSHAMKMGFVSAILADLSLEEVLEFAAEQKFDCVELMCWPKGKAERRYAGVTHIDASGFDDAQAARVRALLKAKNVEISSLGYYPNPHDPHPEKRAVYVDHLKRLIDASALLGVGLVTTFIGRDKNKSVDDNLAEFLKVWPPIVAYAESKKVKIGIENCPMLFSGDEWPGGLNLATTPSIWRRLFAALPSPNFGLNYDPSHLVWQQIDYVKPLYEFRDRIFHVHYKDVRVYRDKLNEVGNMATPLQFMAPKLPGLGDVDWGAFVAALNDIGYNGHACIEVEDKAYEATLKDRKNATILSRRYLSQFTI
jgi:sugar phosphate isomerase/epimerase